MILRLDPRIPLVWRDPFSLQFGVEPARVVLREVSAVQEQLVAALRVGVGESGLGLVAELVGGNATDAVDLVSALEPVLQAPTTIAHPSIEIVGSGPTTEHIARALAESGCRVTVASAVSPTEERPDLGIAVAHYVFDPDVYSHWLRRDIPHLPVTFADGTATVGPLVEPGSGACMHCVEFHRRDSDPLWATIAAQLWGRRSAAETPVVSREVAALATRMVLRRMRASGGAPAATAASSVRLDAETGSVTRTEWLQHPECGCGDLANSSALSAVPRGIGSALARPRTVFPPPPTTVRVAGARG